MKRRKAMPVDSGNPAADAAFGHAHMRVPPAMSDGA